MSMTDGELRELCNRVFDVHENRRTRSSREDVQGWSGRDRDAMISALKLASWTIDNRAPLALIAGPCVVESESLALETAATLRDITERLGIPYVFKGSFDKANRTSVHSPRGPGLDEGLRILESVRREIGVPVLTDVHEDTPVERVAEVVDVLQTPAALVRQTSYIERVAKAGKPIHIKKGTFMAPWDMQHVVEKCHVAGNYDVMICERGACFGYNTLVSDMRALAVMRATGCPVIFDATHSVQEPGGQGSASGGQRKMVPVLARAAVAAGVAGLFMETHPDPDQAWSDGPSQWPLGRVEELLEVLVELDRVVKTTPYPEELM